MLMLSKSPLTHILEQAYTEACAAHGRLDITLGRFAAHILSVISRGRPPVSSAAAATAFVQSLSTSDLYLTAACADGSEAAWERFNTIYSRLIDCLAARFAGSPDRAEDLADYIRVSLFLPTRSATSRIATYDGRSRLSTWLRSLIFNAAAHQRDLIDNSLVHLEPSFNPPAGDSARQLQAVYAANKYGPMIAATLRLATEKLCEQDRVLLLLHYEQQVNMRDIAALHRVNVSTISRRIKRIQAELGRAIVSILASRYLLPQPAIDECIQVMLDGPDHSILKFICLSKAVKE